MQADQIALQLYTLRALTATDLLGTLRQVAALGYPAVEFAGYFGHPATTIRATLDEVGMHACAVHVPLTEFETHPDQVFADLATLGCSYAVVPWIPAERRSTVAQVRELGAILNKLGRQCRDHDIRLAYHNHADEFAALEGTTMWDVLAKTVDPDLVGFEFDVYWAQYGGVDPLTILQRYAGRVPLLHVKDMASLPQGPDRPAGSGVLPWEQILPAAAAAGTQWYIVEQDHPQDPLANVQTSLAFLQLAAD